MRTADGGRLDAPTLRAGLLARVLPGVVLIGTFIGIELWFGMADFYHRDFFEPGWLGAGYNLARIGYTIILFWLIYAPGYALIAAVIPAGRRQGLSLGERLILGFGAGLGLWHVALLILGVAGLYYRPLMIGLAAITLLASAGHFGELVAEARRRLATSWDAMPRGEWTIQALGALSVTLALGWVLLVRGLYPGGGGDYYTHYFPYYINVIKNHGLAPNDVWYHYFYSKGVGLFFFGMLLTDPEAPALATFCCVAAAALGIVTLGARMAPRSLWPASGAVLYLLYSLVSFSGYGGGEFPKDHELVSALAALMVWSVCMERITGDRSFLVAAVSCGVAGTIVTSQMGILLCVCFAVLAGWCLVRKRWRQMWNSVVIGAWLGVAVLCVFLLSYFTVGLATDQPLDLMLRFANFQRLDQYGLLPQLVVVAWIRDNYAALVQPSGWDSVAQVLQFARLDLLWIFLMGAVLVAASRLIMADFRRTGKPGLSRAAAHSATGSAALRALDILAPLLGTLIVISIFAGGAQSISFYRFSTFFVPLLILLGIAGCSWGLVRPRVPLFDGFLRWALPVMLSGGVLVSWQINHDWASRSLQATANGLRFLDGRYSLAEAYSHQDGGFPSGGIDAEGLAAARQLPPGTPIWSTNIFSAYCMAPDCNIESVVSFKTSSQLDEILNGPPELAKQRLQESGLNYFLFSAKWWLLDLLPYSQLFAPDTIGQYLGVKWTDGSVYLLTWAGPETTPIGQKFLAAYTERLNSPESPWFYFRELVPRISAVTSELRTQTHFGEAVDWPWRHPPHDISVVKATYGQNCREFTPPRPSVNTVSVGNATSFVRTACRTGRQCHLLVDVLSLGDPAPGCAKDFSVTYRCAPDGHDRTITAPGEANGKKVMLDCPNSQ